MYSLRSRLVPTCVGMILNSLATDLDKYTCPHTRGDDVIPEKGVTCVTPLSPYAWDVPYIFVLCFNTSGPQAYSSRTHFLIIWRKFLSFVLIPAFSSILIFCFFQQLFFCTHNRISQNYPPYRMSGKEGKNRYYNGVNVFFEYITLYLRGLPE